jgi:Ca-activated chloride channel family protein
LKAIGGIWRFGSLINVYLVKTFFGNLFFLLFFVLVVLSLADLRWGESLVDDDRSGFEAVLAIDVSRSMLSRDIQPSRLERTVGEIKQFISRSRDTRFGVVVFKGEALCILPITEDLYSLEALLDSLSPSLLASPGTNLERAIRRSLDTFRTAGRYRFIMLFTDGEALSGDSIAAAKRAQKRDIPIIAVAVGTEEGASITMENGEVVRDQNDRVVISRLNRKVLQEVASVSRGKSYRIGELPRIERDLLSILKDMPSEEIEPGLRLQKRKRYRLFLTLSLTFLILHILTRALRWKGLL